MTIANDPGLKPFLQEYGSKNSLGSATPFGLSRKKIELLFFKIDTLEKSLHYSPAFAGTSINAPQMESNSTMPLLDSAEEKHGIEKVLRAIEGDRGALTSHNAQELCTLISDDREFFISNLDKSMAYMARDYKMKAKKIPKQYSSVEQYVESSDYILPTPELDKISLLIDIYDRLIKGADLDEVGAVSDLQNNFERLGEILNIPPDEKQIIGGTKHSNATRSRMLGLVLQEVFNRYYNGKLEVKTTTQEVPLPANEEFPVHKKTDFIERNKVNVASLRRAAMDSQKNAVRMVESNIPMMEADLGFSRFELFSFFVLFKALSVVSSQVRQPDGDFITDGCLYEIWRRGVGRLSTMSDNLAYKIYIKIDESMEGILDWREFLKGMQLLNAQTKIDMIDLFLKLADSRRTGFLSFEELRELAQLTLLRYLKISDNRFFKSIAEYFTKLIFEITETPLDQLIELVKIKEKILEVVQRANLG
jgi:Ca2+-binding EF-hand superfamily protein